MSGIHLALFGSNFGSIIPIDYLVVAGGAGGGGYYSGGGGGGGGVRSGSNYEVLTGKTYPVTVGGGGASNVPGNDSTFDTITSAGGGGFAADGGCGGGGRSGDSPGGLGNVPSVNPSQGKNGGDHVVFSPPGFSYNVPGGGGGAGTAGTPGQADVNSTVGGDGVASSITGSSTYYGGGGGGGAYGYGPVPGGLGGGGPSTNSQAPPSPANTGGGGGMGLTGSGFGFGGLGGSGVVILRYPDSYPAAASTTGSPSITVSGGKRIYKFQGSGSIVF